MEKRKMKLRNKRTGEIGIINYFDNQSIVIYPIDENWNAKGDKKYVYHSIAELNEEWEDYEEPKGCWIINTLGIVEYTHFRNGAEPELLKEFGNYFETKEEAEKAVEKLKALTEAKKDGLKIKGYYYNHEDLVILADIGKCNKLTLDTLFGKEID